MSGDISNLILTDDDMKTLLNYHVSIEDAQVLQKKYEEQQETGQVDLETKFQYAWCLTHSQNTGDLKKASILLEELFKGGTEELKRDSLFYLSVAETKQKNYSNAKKYIKAFLSVEPSNVQAQQLSNYIDKQLKKDGVTGMALFGAAAIFGGATAIAVGTFAISAALGYAFKKRHK